MPCARHGLVGDYVTTTVNGEETVTNQALNLDPRSSRQPHYLSHFAETVRGMSNPEWARGGVCFLNWKCKSLTRSWWIHTTHKTRNKRGFLHVARHGRSTREPRLPPKPRARSASTLGPGVAKAPPEPTRKQTPQQVKAGAAARAPAPGGERVACVGPCPRHVSGPLRKWRGLRCKMAASFVVVRNVERLPVSEKRDDLSAGIAEKASRKRWLPRSFQVSLLTEQGTQSPRWRLPLLRRQPEKWERGCVRGAGRGTGPAPCPRRRWDGLCMPGLCVQVE